MAVDDDVLPLLPAGATPTGPSLAEQQRQHEAQQPPTTTGDDSLPLASAPAASRSLLGTPWSKLGVKVWDDPGDTPSSLSNFAGVDTSIQPSPNAASLMPVSVNRNDPAGSWRLAVPNAIRAMLTEGPQYDPKVGLKTPAVTVNPDTGSLGVTPEAAAAAGLISPSGLRFSGAAPLVRDPVSPFTITKPPPVTLDELKAAIGRADQMPPQAAPVPPAPPPFRQPTTAKEAFDANQPWWDIVNQNKGAALNPQYVNQGLDAAIKKLQPEGPLSAATATGPTGQLAINLAAGKDQPITLGDYAQNDRNIGDLIGQSVRAGTDNTTRILQDVRGDLRDHFQGAGPNDVVGGQEGFDALDPARAGYTAASRMSDLEKILYDAKMAPNEGTYIRGKTASYLRSDDSRGLSDMQRAAVEQATKPGFGGTALNIASNRILAPAVGGALGYGAGGLLGIPGAFAGAGVGELARAGSAAIARSRLQNAITTLGQSVPPPPEL